MGYLTQVYTQTNGWTRHWTAGTCDRNRAGTYLHLPQSSQRMLHAGRLSRHGRSAKRLLNRSGQRHGTPPARQSRQWGKGDGIVMHRPFMKAIVPKDDFIENCPLRAKPGPNAAIQGKRWRHRHHSSKTWRRIAILLRGKMKKLRGNKEKTESSYQKVTELVPSTNKPSPLGTALHHPKQTEAEKTIELFTEATELNPISQRPGHHERGRQIAERRQQGRFTEDMKKGPSQSQRDTEL